MFSSCNLVGLSHLGVLVCGLHGDDVEAGGVCLGNRDGIIGTREGGGVLVPVNINHHRGCTRLLGAALVSG